MKNQETELTAKKVSLEQLRKIWDDEDKTYTDEELMKLREWLYVVAQSVISVTKRIEKENSEQQAKIITLNAKHHEQTQSDIVYPGKYRRAG